MIRRNGWRELTLVALGFALLTACLTYPLAVGLGTLGRTDNADGEFSIWNVVWVARTLAVDPLHVFDANIFYPHRLTLAYSEANLGAGVLAMPAYWLTGNPIAAFNVVVLLSFILSGVATYALVRYLVDDRRAAVVSAVAFAFCPYLFGHIPHIQLLMTAGLPLSLLTWHRLTDRPTATRAVALGLALSGQTLFCAYYGVMAMLMVGYGVLFMSVSSGRWRARQYWTPIGIAAAVAIASTLPFALPYLWLQSDTGFSRSLDAARGYSASWRMYFASNSFVHAPMMTLIGRTGEFLFPGFVTLGLTIGGAKAVWSANSRIRELAGFYASLAALAFWASLGPAAGLYRALYLTVPGFTFMRAPSRFGLLVGLAVAVLAGLGFTALLARSARATWIAAALVACAVVELATPLRWRPAPAVDAVYRALATQPRGALLELPVYSHQFRFLRAHYMLASTYHWMPLVVAYSDYIPPDFTQSLGLLSNFPSSEAFAHLERDRVRYVVFHLSAYAAGPARERLNARLTEFGSALRLIHADEGALLYEIVGYPH